MEEVWIEAIKVARQLHRDFVRYPPEMSHPDTFMPSIRILQKHFHDASRLRHVLAWSLLDTVDDLAADCAESRQRSLIMLKGAPTLIRYLRRRLDKRHEELALMQPVRARLLLKLYAVRCFIGSRTLLPESEAPDLLQFPRQNRLLNSNGLMDNSPVASPRDRVLDTALVGSIERMRQRELLRASKRALEFAREQRNDPEVTRLLIDIRERWRTLLFNFREVVLAEHDPDGDSEPVVLSGYVLLFVLHLRCP